MKRILISAAFLCAAISPALAQRPCLQIGQIYNWKAINDKTLIVEDYSHQKFKLNLIGTCYDLTFHERLAFKSIGGMAISCLTPGDEVISRNFGMGPTRCSITKIEAYTPAMEQADKAAAAAKAAGK